MPYHRNVTENDGIHRLTAWTFTTHTNRLAFTPAVGIPATSGALATADIYKTARVTSDGTMWLLTNHSPVTWQQLPSGPFLQSASGATVLGSGGTHTLAFTPEQGFVYELLARVVAEDGAGDVAFEANRVIVCSRPAGGTQLIRDVDAGGNLAANWSFDAALNGNNVDITVTNSTASERGVRISIEVAVQQIPAAP